MGKYTWTDEELNVLKKQKTAWVIQKQNEGWQEQDFLQFARNELTNQEFEEEIAPAIMSESGDHIATDNNSLDNFNNSAGQDSSSGNVDNEDERRASNCCNDGSRDGEFDVDTSRIKFFSVENKYIERFTEAEILNNHLEEPINYYDPIVYHDPANPIAPFIVKLQNTTGVADASPLPDNDNRRIEAIKVPVVRLNTSVLNMEQIEALTMTFTGFLPELTLIISSSSNSVEAYPTTPGLNNMIHVVIMPGIDGKYKKISLPFYITNVYTEQYDKTITYTAKLKHMPLIQHLFVSEAVDYPGCDHEMKGDKCNPDPSKKPNMWELCHEIAMRTGLGFAAQRELREYNDRTPRTISSHNYQEFLEYNVEIGGLDETQIYDMWVDPYGYLTLVDLYKILHSDTKPSNLAMYAETGFQGTSLLTQEGEYKDVRRVITNSNMTKAGSNIMIEEYYNGSDMGKIHEHGTLNTMYYFCPFGNNGVNNIVAEQIRIKEDSKDGAFVQDYEIAKYTGWSFVGCDNYNISRQMELRDAYITELRNSNRALTVKLRTPNYALQRGQLVNVLIMSYSYDYKMRLINQESNLYDNSQAKGIHPDNMNTTVDGWNNDDLLYNDGIGVVMPENSGLYYIDGMRFDYIKGNRGVGNDAEIVEYLYLIRKGPLTGLSNLSTFDRLKWPTPK